MDQAINLVIAARSPVPRGVSGIRLGRYRKRPVEIDAYCYDQRPENYRPDWFSDAVSANLIITHPDCCFIKTLEGTMRAAKGDWIIRGVQGEIYSCKPDIFVATYEPA